MRHYCTAAATNKRPTAVNARPAAALWSKYLLSLIQAAAWLPSQLIGQTIGDSVSDEHMAPVKGRQCQPESLRPGRTATKTVKLNERGGFWCCVIDSFSVYNCSYLYTMSSRQKLRIGRLKPSAISAMIRVHAPSHMQTMPHTFSHDAGTSWPRST